MRKIVLMYHDVYHHSPQESGFDTNGANHYKIEVSKFEAQLKVLAEMVERNRICKDDIVLTFDDGGVSFSNVIMPLLDKYGFKGHFYVSTDYIDTNGFMTAEQVKSLTDNGHIVGSHSCSHPNNISSMHECERIYEWTKSLEILKQICGCSINEISIPNGYFSKKDTSLFKSIGIETIYTSLIGEDKMIDNLHVMGRVAINTTTSISQFREMIAGGWELQKLVVRQTILQAVKALMGNQYIVIKKTLRRWIH